MALAANLCWVLSKAYSALPGGSKGCGGDDFSSGWSMNNFPSGEYRNFCIKTREKVHAAFGERTFGWRTNLRGCHEVDSPTP
ncbi:hypothetical protein NC651_031978 [Populus alba x Populus x berolinensis]|nr:hypothetical protein NC651_031978 [Populus alba x Populus x berolinensis]